MSLLRPLDPTFPIERQLAVDAKPVVLVNVITLDKADEQAFLQTWHDDALFMKQQPGFISTQLHRAIGESPTYLNYAVWESTADYRAAFTHPEFRAKPLGPSILCGRFPAPIPKGCSAGHLCRIAAESVRKRIGKYEQSDEGSELTSKFERRENGNHRIFRQQNEDRAGCNEGSPVRRHRFRWLSLA